MKYIIGYDGGGSKTRCVLANTHGEILSDLVAGPSNHQMIGIEKTKEVIKDLYLKTLEKTNLAPENIEAIYLGLAGADLPCDFEILNKMGREIFKNPPFQIVNDAWIILKSGLLDHWGAVSIYGTGANAAVITPTGERKILRALGYIAGGYGGGGDMAKEALHLAFRSNEKTHERTQLEVELPKLFNKSSMNDLLKLLYPKNKITEKSYKKIPPLVFELAKSGDQVCIGLLKKMGKTQGQMVIGVLKSVNLEVKKVPVVIGGSIYNGVSNHFVESMLLEIKKYASDAYLVKPKYPPVYGALFSAYEHAGIDIPKHFK